jgi:hypothetical protein
VSPALERLLVRLEAAKGKRPDPARTARILESFEGRVLADATDLIRLHEALLFLRAYPQDRATFAAAERLLSRFGDHVERFAASEGDLEPFDRPDVSGIAGTAISTDYSFDVVRWLASRFPRRIRLDWERQQDPDRLRGLLPKFLPLLDEEALEDANVPYLDWLRAGEPDGWQDPAWLLARIGELPLSQRERAERYEALRVPIVWKLGKGTATRTRMRWRPPGRGRFFHREPLIARRDVSLAEAMAAPPLPLRKLSRAEGEQLVDLTRGASALRYREYYGFTYADPASVRVARAGRGVEIFLMGLERGRRLPLRAGFAGFAVKNGVPVGYIEGLAFFERIEIGFNIYYTFREGESAWIFGRVLRLLNQVYGVTSFSIDPYQLGHENDEAIESGAFWFYRKLGFRPTSPKIARLVEAEERRIEADPAYRSSPRALRRIVTGNLLYETDRRRSGDWDRFHIRNLGLAVQRRMRARYGGDAERARRESGARIAKTLGVRPDRWTAAERKAFGDLALVLDLVPGLSRWRLEERDDLAGIIRTKAGPEEIRYLQGLQRHLRLRQAMIRLGSHRGKGSSGG